MPKTIALGLTHPGTVRNRNGDAFYLVNALVMGDPGGLASHALHDGHAVQFFAMASGIGGHGIGDVAAQMALTELEEASIKVRDPERFDFFAFGRDFLQKTDQTVRRALKDKADAYAGASLAVLCLAGENAYILSCGDCRCYRLRDGELMLLTDDDARTEEPPHRLTSFLGRLSVDRPDELPRLRQFPLETEDVFLLTSHGLTDVIDDDALADRLNAPEGFTAKPDHLLRQALAQNASENLSLILLRVIDLAAIEVQEPPAGRFPHHRVRRPNRKRRNFLRGLLVLLASIALGLFAGWILLTMVF